MNGQLIPDIDRLIAEKGGSVSVAAYCRVSTDSPEQLTSFKNQKEYFSSLVFNKPELKLTRVYADEGLSGTMLKKRDAFLQMLDDAYRGEIDLILTKEVSRFARNAEEFLGVIRRLRSHNVGVVFLNTSCNTLYMNPGEIMYLSLAAVIAESESRATSERVKWGQRRQMEKGVAFGRKEMLGYRISGKKMTIVPEEAEIVRMIFGKYVFEGKGTTVIANELHSMGIPSFRLKRWTTKVILDVLRNEKYAGDLMQQKTYTPDCLTHEKKYNRGQLEKVYIRDHHEPIISRSLWDMAQEELKRRSPSEEQKSRYSNRYWCSGKLRCGVCGAAFVNRRKKLADGSAYLAWRCSEAALHGKRKRLPTGEMSGCDSPSANNKVLLYGTAFVLRMAEIDKKALIREIRAEITSVISGHSARKAVDYRDKIDEAETLKRRSVDLMLRGIITEDELVKQKKHYDEMISEYKSKLREEQENEIGSKQYYTNPEDCIGRMLDLDEPDEHICGRLLERITVCGDNRLSVKLNFLPYAVVLRYDTCGRKEDYKVDITLVDGGASP